MKIIDIVEEEPFEICLFLNLLFTKKTIGLLCYREFDGYLQIDKFCIHKYFRGKGLGYKMITFLKNDIVGNYPEIKWIQVYPKSEDTLSNTPIALQELYKKYERFGFRGDMNFSYSKRDQLMKLLL